MTKPEQIPAALLPGSELARSAGCTCPHDQPQACQSLYWMVETCPIHGPKPQPLTAPLAPPAKEAQ